MIVERNELIAAQTGDNPRPVIAKAIRDAGVETILGVGVTAVDEGGVTLSNGERIESATVIWTAGMRASPLTAQIPAPRDNLGRLIVDPDLRVPGVKNVFATGDTAKVAADDLGNVAPMTCQFAIRLGAFAGHNAAADLLGLPTEAYHQKTYVVCLDLGAPARSSRGDGIPNWNRPERKRRRPSARSTPCGFIRRLPTGPSCSPPRRRR